MLEQLYNIKKKTAEEAVNLISNRSNLVVGMSVSQPPALLNALAGRAASRRFEELKVYYMHSTESMKNTILRYSFMDVIKPHPFFLTSIERDLIERSRKERKKVVFYIPVNFSEVANILKRYVNIDVCLLMVSSLDKAGYFSCGTNCDYTISAARRADNLIVEVNPNMPRVPGETFIHLSEVDAIVENISPLHSVQMRQPTTEDNQICKFIASLVPNQATLQLGIGVIPNLLCDYLLDHKDLGVHTELLGPGFIKLIKARAVTNKYKNINRHKSVYTFAMGDEEFYQFIDDNIGLEALPAAYVNNPYVISQNDNVISVSSFIEIDLFGQVNSEYLNGKQFSAPGGQLDFIRGAALSKRGRSILAAPSTAKKGTVSRIVPIVKQIVTDPRAEIHHVVTEYGVANLRGKSIYDRAESLINIAHPKFRRQLGEAMEVI